LQGQCRHEGNASACKPLSPCFQQDQLSQACAPVDLDSMTWRNQLWERAQTMLLVSDCACLRLGIISLEWG
jgi:hypothetical protein